MKKLFTKLFLLVALVMVGVNAWAVEKSYTLTFKTSGSTSDGSSVYATDVTKVFGETSYVSSIASVSSVYPGRDGRGAKFGTSSKVGTIQFNLSDDGKVTATKIKVTGGAYISSKTAEKAAFSINDGTTISMDQTVEEYTEADYIYTFETPTDLTSIKIAQKTATGGRFYIKTITVYYEESENSLEVASWSTSPSEVAVFKGKTAQTTVSTNYDGTINVASQDESIATVSFDAETGIITVAGVACGNTNVTVTGSATSTYKAINKTIPVTVSVEEMAFNKTIDLSNKFGYEYFGYTPTGTNTYAQPDVESTTKTDGILTILIARNGTSNSKPRYDASYLRLYKGNTISFALPLGYFITSVTFVEPASGKSWEGSMDVSEGFYDDNTKKWTATEESNTVTLTGTGNTKRIGGVVVKVITPSGTSVTITSAGYSTFFDSANAVELPAGVQAGPFTAANGLKLTYESGDVVPAGVPVVLKAEEGTYTLSYTTGGTTPEENNLFGTDVDTALTPDANSYFYGLSLNSAGETESVGFYWMNATGAAFTNGAHKAYLKLPKTSGARSGFAFNEDTEAISTIENEEAETAAFNLAGQRVENAKGLVIKNGKKMYIK